MRNEVLIHWQIQESLLQSYRGLFLTSQAIIFSFASIIATENNPTISVFFILLMLGLVLLIAWYSIANARGLDVSYFQMLLIKLENEEKLDCIMINFKEWQALKRKQKKQILKEFKLYKSKTRLIFELIIPIIFLFVWIALSAVIFF